MPRDSVAGGADGQELRLSRSDQVAQALVAAIHAGELGTLTGLLHEHPGLAAVRLVDDKGGSGTPLHAAADWPGFFPHGPEVVAMLIGAGADPSAPVEGSWHAETAEYLLARGAELNGTPSWGEGTPLDAADNLGTGREALVEWLRSQGARKSAKAAE
jgi:Ankyrin repeat